MKSKNVSEEKNNKKKKERGKKKGNENRKTERKKPSNGSEKKTHVHMWLLRCTGPVTNIHQMRLAFSSSLSRLLGCTSKSGVRLHVSAN